ncbi:unnamed protein product [Caenorhabditis angaria]|uniref:C-type lectin domain-containing protein n=1 Tax=Caenorhabditis angaria TaxID=860376 RepID=A0A9P1I8W2_9PELO|nr:unnamed protein product [Caenorhabditis angaria]
MIVKVLVFLCLLQLVDSCRLRCRNRTQCDDGWTYYKRSKTGWCMKMLAEQNLTKIQADQSCSNFGAVISSIDDSSMNTKILSLKNVPGATQTLLGATYKFECFCGEYSCELTDNCGRNGYYWTDGYTTSNDYILDNLGIRVFNITENNIMTTRVFSYDVLIINAASNLQTTYSTNTFDSVICGKKSNY